MQDIAAERPLKRVTLPEHATMVVELQVCAVSQSFATGIWGCNTDHCVL